MHTLSQISESKALPRKAFDSELIKFAGLTRPDINQLSLNLSQQTISLLTYAPIFSV